MTGTISTWETNHQIPASEHRPFLSIAPMMDRTDRHYRYFMRQITRHTLLYTEMVVTAAVLNGDRQKLLGYSPEEKPLALQVGGDSPQELAECAKIAADWGYDEINLNIGCPSDRVQNGNFGACLMAEPDTVARCVEAMRQAADIPVTVKHRIGIDNLNRYEDMRHFVRIVAAAGCRHFTIHARCAWLQGLNPAENRNVPPLRYQDIYRLKQEFPHLYVEINGGIKTLEQVREHLQLVDAAMIGRAAYDNPYLFATVDRDFFGEETVPPTRAEIVRSMYDYIDHWVSRGVKLHKISRHMLQLFSGKPGSRAWRRYLTEHACRPDADSQVMEAALQYPLEMMAASPA
mgnify:CR=1 FL=1